MRRIGISFLFAVSFRSGDVAISALLFAGPLPPALPRHLILPTLALWRDSRAATTLLSCNFWLLGLIFPKASTTPWPVGKGYRPGFRDSHFVLVQYESQSQSVRAIGNRRRLISLPARVFVPGHRSLPIPSQSP